jgi:serine/threonine protein kinase
VTYSFKHGDRPLDGYVIQRGVGCGGFGEVYHAVSDSGKEVALKYLRHNPLVELRGVTQCLNLKSPHLITIYDIRQNAGGEYFVIMEYVSGPSLRDLLIAEPKGIGVQKAAFFLREIAKGLAYLHDRGIVHRDLKPGNIFYEDGYVKIGDYGLSKAIATSQHSGQTISVGTVHYMAPEIGSGDYSRTIDIYALGVVVYEMLLGRVPFRGASMGEVLMKPLMEQPDVDELPPPFPAMIRKALAKDPKERYTGVHEMVQAAFAHEDLESSVRTFEPTSLTTAAVRLAQHTTTAPADASGPTFERGAGLFGAGSSNLSEPGLSRRAGELTLAGRMSTPEDEAEEHRRRQQWGKGLLLAALCYAFAGPCMMQAGAPLGAVGLLVVVPVVGMIAAAVHLHRRRKHKLKLRLPLDRSFITVQRRDLSDIVLRYFASLGYRPTNKDPLLWGFERGSRKSEFWSGDIRKYLTQVNVAAYELPDAYRVICHLDLENSWGSWITQAELTKLARELEGLEEVLNTRITGGPVGRLMEISPTASAQLTGAATGG